MSKRVIAWLRAYALIGFSNSAITGTLFALATFVVPGHGLLGAVGLVMTDLWARILGRPSEHINSGFYGLNGLLTGLALGLYFQLSWSLFALLICISLFVVLLAAAMKNLSDRYVGIPVMSLPFVIVTWVALLATRRFGDIEYTVDPILISHLGAAWIPDSLHVFLRSLGACILQLSVLSGVLVFAGLLWSSRWTAIMAVLGFCAGEALYTALSGPIGDLERHFIGFNFILTAIAIGGVFVVLSPRTLLLAVASSTLSAVVAAASLSFLESFTLPILALPFVATTQLVFFALSVRGASAGLQLVTADEGSPERNLRAAVLRRQRYPDPTIPGFYLPVMGSWVITQSHYGKHTHRGLWAHAWDFEVADASGGRYQGSGYRCEDWLAYGAPVIAPAPGRVIRVVNHVPDNEPGEVNTKDNWGNLVVLWHTGNIYSVVCHLQPGSIAVREGEPIVCGAVLGRVGNSGRSPVPHLHFHIQRSPEVGAPTCRAELLHYLLESDGATPRYITRGIPDEGDRVCQMPVADVTRRALTVAPGRVYEWFVQTGNRSWRERWRSDIDALGSRSIGVVERNARAGVYADEHYLTILDYDGPRDTLLALFALAAARIPYVPPGAATWTDRPAGDSFLPWPVRLVNELVLPFAPVGTIATKSTMGPCGDDIVVTTELSTQSPGAYRLPDRIEVVFRPSLGPVKLRAARNGHTLLWAWIEGQTGV